MFNFPIKLGDSLAFNGLDQQGFFNVPNPLSGEKAYHAFIPPLINRYGYVNNGVATGGGGVGGASQINEQNFKGESIEFGWDYSIITPNVTHDLHMGVHIDPLVRSSSYGDPRSYFNPRRDQLMAKFIFRFRGEATADSVGCPYPSERPGCAGRFWFRSSNLSGMVFLVWNFLV